MPETAKPTERQPTTAELRLQTLALRLYDEAEAAHHLRGRARGLLQYAAAYYAAALTTNHERPDRLGRDMVLAAPISNLEPDDQAIVACALALQRPKMRPQRETVFQRLSGKEKQLALGLAAILRLAQALDAEQANGTRVEVDGDVATVSVGGEQASKRARRADERADLWRDRIGPLTIRTADTDEHASTAEPATDAPTTESATDLVLAVPSLPGQAPGGEPIAEAARRQLRQFFDKLLAREDAVRDGEDVEDVHQMRVATRRIRASLQVVEGIYKPKPIRRFRRGLREVAQSLGAVRDGDVFLGHVIAYRESLAAEAHAQLEPLISAVSAERAQARERLLANLDAKRYKKLKHAFALFLTTPGADTLAAETGLTPRVRDFAGSAIWQRYEHWRAYETVLAGATDATLHQTRIAGKHLRYTLEFFADALGPDVEQVLAPLVELQECLGALQDIVTAHVHIDALGLKDDPGAQAYLAARDAERTAHREELLGKWEKVASATYRRQLFELLNKL